MAQANPTQLPLTVRESGETRLDKMKVDPKFAEALRSMRLITMNTLNANADTSDLDIQGPVVNMIFQEGENFTKKLPRLLFSSESNYGNLNDKQRYFIMTLATILEQNEINTDLIPAGTHIYINLRSGKFFINKPEEIKPLQLQEFAEVSEKSKGEREALMKEILEAGGLYDAMDRGGDKGSYEGRVAFMRAHKDEFISIFNGFMQDDAQKLDIAKENFGYRKTNNEVQNAAFLKTYIALKTQEFFGESPAAPAEPEPVAPAVEPAHAPVEDPAHTETVPSGSEKIETATMQKFETAKKELAAKIKENTERYESMYQGMVIDPRQDDPGTADVILSLSTYDNTAKTIVVNTRITEEELQRAKNDFYRKEKVEAGTEFTENAKTNIINFLILEKAILEIDNAFKESFENKVSEPAQLAAEPASQPPAPAPEPAPAPAEALPRNADEIIQDAIGEASLVLTDLINDELEKNGFQEAIESLYIYSPLTRETSGGENSPASLQIRPEGLIFQLYLSKEPRFSEFIASQHHRYSQEDIYEYGANLGIEKEAITDEMYKEIVKAFALIKIIEEWENVYAPQIEYYGKLKEVDPQVQQLGSQYVDQLNKNNNTNYTYVETSYDYEQRKLKIIMGQGEDDDVEEILVPGSFTNNSSGDAKFLEAALTTMQDKLDKVKAVASKPKAVAPTPAEAPAASAQPAAPRERLDLEAVQAELEVDQALSEAATAQQTADLVQLREEMKTYAKRNVHKAVSEAFEKMMTAGLPAEPEDYLRGTKAALALGDIALAYRRIEASVKASGVERTEASQELATIRFQIESNYGSVVIKTKARKRNRSFARVGDIPMRDVNAKPAIEAASEAIKKDGFFSGYLPSGRYLLNGSDIINVRIGNLDDAPDTYDQ